MKEHKKTLSRRDFLRGAAYATAGAVVTACAPQVIKETVEVEKVVTKEVEKIVKETVEVEKIVVATPDLLVYPGPYPPSSAEITGDMVMIQGKSWFPEHNEFVRNSVIEFARAQGWAKQFDVSYATGFVAGGNIQQKLVASVAAGAPPDVVDHSWMSTHQLHFLDALEPVDYLAEEMIEQFGQPTPGHKADHYEDGHWWAVPYLVHSGGHHTRRDLFEAAGVDVEKDLETWEGVAEACMKVSDPDKEIWGWGNTLNRSGDGNNMMVEILHAWGGHLCDETGEYVTLDSSETVEALTWVTNLFLDPKYEKMMPPGIEGWDDMSNNEHYLSGKIAMTKNGGTIIAKAYYDKNPVAEATAILQAPFGPARLRLQGAGGGRWYIPKGAKNQEAAADLIRFMCSEPMQKKYWEIGTAYQLPAYEWGWDDPIIQNVDASRSFRKIAWDPSGETGGLYWPGPPSGAAEAVYNGNVLTDMAAAILTGTSPADAVKEAHERAVQIYKEFGKKGA